MKLAEESYEKPEFPPPLEWWEIHRGSEQAGELLATFELLEVGQLLHENFRSEQVSVVFINHFQTKREPDFSLPELPECKEMITFSGRSQQNTGPTLPVPDYIRPTLAKYRFENHHQYKFVNDANRPRNFLQNRSSILGTARSETNTFYDGRSTTS